MAFVQFKGGQLFVSDRAKIFFAILLALPILGLVWSMLQEHWETDRRARQMGEQFCETQKEISPEQCRAFLERYFDKATYTKCLLEGTTYERLRKKGVMGP